MAVKLLTQLPMNWFACVNTTRSSMGSARMLTIGMSLWEGERREGGKRVSAREKD